MTIDEYFGNWMRVLDRAETMKIMGWLKTVNPDTLCPTLPNIFKAFKLCPYNKLKLVILGLDPYCDRYNNIPRATGLAFGNDTNIPENSISPSLEVLKEAIINYEVPHNNIIFDNSLESIAKQGVLLINTALTCEFGKTESHSNQWRLFIGKLLRNLSNKERMNVYVLFGKQAQSFKPYINSNFNTIIEAKHPS